MSTWNKPNVGDGFHAVPMLEDAENDGRSLQVSLLPICYPIIEIGLFLPPPGRGVGGGLPCLPGNHILEERSKYLLIKSSLSQFHN